ncbi:MAG: hypothetical protein CM1200mP41_29010 [Gammaproteobacteria bacterium]|nr:MAG: hypothetical protein CM1200mP41_29010 [Gammaproteobacteria bacterium]
MANSAQARKRARQAIGRRSRNVARKIAMRTQIKKFMTVAESGKKTPQQHPYSSASSTIDRASQKGLTHRNKAARLKRQLNAKLKAMVTAKSPALLFGAGFIIRQDCPDESTQVHRHTENTLDIVTGSTDNLSGFNRAVVDQATSNLDLLGLWEYGPTRSPLSNSPST